MNYKLFHWINHFADRFALLDHLMEFFAQDIIWILFVILTGLWLSGKEKYQKSVFYACLTSVIALFFASVMISPLVHSPRPFVHHTIHQLIPHANDPSFPSDHATLAFSFAWCIWLRHRKWGLTLLILAFITGIARVYVGVHYPADIFGGLLLGFIVAWIVRKAETKLDPIPAFFIRIYRSLTRSILSK